MEVFLTKKTVKSYENSLFWLEMTAAITKGLKKKVEKERLNERRERKKGTKKMERKKEVKQIKEVK